MKVLNQLTSLIPDANDYAYLYVLIQQGGNVSIKQNTTPTSFLLFMKDIKHYFTDSSIVKILCRQRAKIAHKRHKKHMQRDISLHERTNKIQVDNEDIDFNKLREIFPSRRKWKQLNQNERKNPKKNGNSIEKNEYRLWKTYKYEKYLVERENKPPESWYLKLCKYCEHIRDNLDSIEEGCYTIKTPQIIPLLKSIKKGKYTYRPIAIYSLEDKIITSLFSRYLTVTFDNLFYPCSFAFRARNSEYNIPTHHDSISEILKYKKKNKRIWVSECDIQKFFDTVQHAHLLKVFSDSISKLFDKGIYISDLAVKIFKLFLDSYSFNQEVLIKNNDTEYFEKYNVVVGKFGWVETEIEKRYTEKYIRDYKIGVPQGNAISCFISNLMLNQIDEKIIEYNKTLLYVRYCDDMILAHKNEKICSEALEIYKEGIRDNYLFYHEPVKISNYKDNAQSFWEKKSKEPYFWGNKYENENNVPWLSFVGYQINYKREIRVRKSSIEKELKKQIKETQQILFSLGMNRKRKLPQINSYSRKTKRQIVFSLKQRLISMSVGRTTIYNYSEPNLEQGLCWTNGFKKLSYNKIVSKQLRRLDRGREQQLIYLRRAISHLQKETKDIDELPKYMDNLYYGLPYSYYNHIV